ncbi:MAG: dual specificity protein phosphatase family protein [Planctomycetes bacterium]|nr:dual specificity protein phosphatase family protein [Planctomycetota bacterium]
MGEAMIGDFHCKCGTLVVFRGNLERIRCPKCQHVFLAKAPVPGPRRQAARRYWSAAFALLLVLLALLSSSWIGISGEEVLAGLWEFEEQAAAEETVLSRGKQGTDRANIDFRTDGTWAGRMPGIGRAGSWKTVRRIGRKLTVVLASPGGVAEPVEITIHGQDRLALRWPGDSARKQLRRSAVAAPQSLSGVADVVPGIVAGDPSNADYSLIEANLYMGAAVPEPPPGTRAVINLCEKYDHYRSQLYLWTPIADAAPAPAISWLHHWVKVVHAARRKGLTTYVHCRGGVSRSGLLVVAYCMFEHGWTRDQALEFVRSKRPVTRPNPAFMELLLRWEQFLRQS